MNQEQLLNEQIILIQKLCHDVSKLIDNYPLYRTLSDVAQELNKSN